MRRYLYQDRPLLTAEKSRRSQAAGPKIITAHAMNKDLKSVVKFLTNASGFAMYAAIAMSESGNNDFIVWGHDQVPYGPVELPALVSWVQDERVTEDSWIYVRRDSTWMQAPQVAELQMFFRPKKKAGQGSSGASPDLRLLRRMKILASFSEEQIEHFARFIEIQEVPQHKIVVKQGDPGDAMYLILQGELRVRFFVGEKETILATLPVGEFFGDISLFDGGPRSADVVANVDSLVGRLSVSSFEQLAREAPDLAAPFLRAVGRTLTARIRADNKRLGDSVRLYG